MPRALPDATAAPAVILNAGSGSYAFGLRWTSARRGSLLAEAEAAALAEGANYVVIHRGFNQFGLATFPDRPLGASSALFRPLAGAAAVANSVGTAALAAFPLDDGRWLVLAIDRKGILPDGDRIVPDEKAARARVDLLIGQSPIAWRRKYLPAGWGIPDSKSISPEGLLSRSRVPRLLSLWLLTRRRQLLLGFGSLVAFSAVGAALVVHLLTVSSPIAQMPFQPPKPVAAIWTPAGLAIDRCLSALRDAQRYRAVPGWITAKYVCQGGAAMTVSFARSGDGQISMLRTLVPAALLSDDGRSAALTLALEPLPHVSALAEFASRQRYQLTGLDLAQRLNGTFALQGARSLLPGETVSPAGSQAWTVLAWSFQTQAPAIVWASAIARLGSISVDTLTYSPSDNLWLLAGSLYASN